MSKLSPQYAVPVVPTVLRIPLEIFGEIAQLALALGVSPLILSHVCRDWRINTIGTKNLWNNITIGWHIGEPFHSICEPIRWK
ncbi:hypothetical protein CPB86DRAFT_410227 [Serendipita vermifera]|nr:hypothetical protein CPB86DRAFT_410227 [Serendipita vermifera]